MQIEALELLRDVAVAEPHRYDVFALAMPLARETKDFEALRWVCKGILSKAWPREHRQDVPRSSNAREGYRNPTIASRPRPSRLEAFNKEIQESSRRDVAVRVTWTGDADLDIRVKEPAGTICSVSNPQTRSGGVLLGGHK